MRVFIVRPFGNRSVVKKDKSTGVISSVNFDFDKVERELIKPAMKQLNLSGGTTGEVFEAGDIREDMFSELLIADIVIADISIYNANVFYELGIRHALRDKRTVLIKCSGFDETPFDIIAYRYISYDEDKPAESLENLKRSIRETIDTNRTDSPVFNVLPQLIAQDPEKYLALPKDFINSVRIAEASKQTGMLALLAYEAESFGWKIPALRLIGEALFKMKALETAKIVWEKIIKDNPNDLKANELLATIYQRLAEQEMKMNPEEAISLLVKSDLAIEILIKDDCITNSQKAEAYALQARNAKTNWINSWNGLTGIERNKKALKSLYLQNALKFYEKGFCEDLNHFYSGINALGLLITLISLAENNSDIWELDFETKEEADRELRNLKNKFQKLSTTVQVSIEASKNKLENKGETDNWLNITEADFNCLISSNPAKVASIYQRVLESANELNWDATIRQLKIYESLEIKTENVKAALSVFPNSKVQQKQNIYYILFTGHMIDKAERKEPRFPPSKEDNVRKSITEALTKVKNNIDENNSFVGIAGGACGGDIMFHEICAEIGIRSELYLALPRDQFLVESVAFAGNNWIDRFDNLYRKLTRHILSDDLNLPKWLKDKEDYNIWTRNNLWELNSALVNGGMNMTLIALWDGKGGDGQGGTEHMVKEAKSRGAKTINLDINKL